MVAAKKTKKITKVMQLGPVTVDSSDDPDRIAMMLWGPSSAGKTTWAATAPGEKLWLSFGDNEHGSVKYRPDVHVADLSKLSLDDLFLHGQSDNPFGLDQLLNENENIQTVVADSATALTFRALEKAVKEGIGSSNKFKPTMMFPGQSAYGGRNGIVLQVVTGLMRVTAKYGVHFILTAHEADPTMSKQDASIIDYIGVMLGGQLVNNMSLRMSEIWHYRHSTSGDRERIVSFRPTGNRRTMKSRMFRYDQEASFIADYDANKPDEGQMTIASIWDDWCAVNGGRLDVPKAVSHSKGKGK